MRLACLILVLLFAAPAVIEARSVLSPKHSGLDAPGRVHSAPMPSYTDAYGNGLTDKIPEEKKPRKRLRPGATGSAPKISNPGDNYLPPSPAEKTQPLWGF